MDLPRRLQIEFSRCIKVITEGSGTEITAEEMWDAFAAEYLAVAPRTRLAGYETASNDGSVTVRARLAAADATVTISGEGNGPSRPWSTLCAAISDRGRRAGLRGACSRRRRGSHGRGVCRGSLPWRGSLGRRHGPNITTASMKAVLSALERLGVAWTVRRTLGRDRLTAAGQPVRRPGPVIPVPRPGPVD